MPVTMEIMMRNLYPMKRDALGVSIGQYEINGWDISYNPDDNYFYICNRNSYGDMETVARYDATSSRAWGNVLYFARHKKA